MSGYEAAGWPSVLHHNEPRHRRRIPATIPPKQLRNDATLPIQRREEILDVQERRLDLDDQERPARRMPADDINRPALAVVTERVLRHCLPASIVELAQDRLHEPRVSLVQEPRHLRGGHARRELSADADCLGHEPNRPDGEAIQPTRFDEGNRRLVDAARRLHVELTPPLADARRTNEPAEPAIIHAPMIELAAYRPLTDA